MSSREKRAEEEDVGEREEREREGSWLFFDNWKNLVMNCSINQIQPSSVGSYLEGDWMCLVSDTLTLTLRDLKNLCDSVSPNIETTGFTPLFARVLPPWPQIGPVLVPSPDLTIKIFH